MQPNAVDKALLALSGALTLTGVVVLGIVEILAGEPYGAAPVEQTNAAGEVVNTIYPAVDPTIRTGLVVLGLVVLLALGVYRMARGVGLADERTHQAEVVAD